ncbi:hypothetical protein AZE42_11602, partial [Rhizopogon vesiculosus]
MIEFFAVLKTDLLPVEVSDNAKIFQIFHYLKSKSDVGDRILGSTKYDQYEYYKLKNPVLFSDDRAIADIVKDCLDKNNWQE